MPTYNAVKMPYSHLWKTYFTETRGVAAANHLIDGIQVEYRKICLNHGTVVHGGLRKHLHGNIFPQMAAYQTLLEDHPHDKALSKIQELHLLTLNKMKKRHEWIGQFRISYSFYRIAVPLSLKYDHPSAGWEIEFIENSRKRICAKVHSCFYYNTLMAYGLDELISIYCNGDEYVFNEAESSYIRWGRTSTLPAGGDYCDVVFHKRFK